jgi:hypothetical protein
MMIFLNQNTSRGGDWEINGPYILYTFLLYSANSYCQKLLKSLTDRFYVTKKIMSRNSHILNEKNEQIKDNKCACVWLLNWANIKLEGRKILTLSLPTVQMLVLRSLLYTQNILICSFLRQFYLSNKMSKCQKTWLTQDNLSLWNLSFSCDQVIKCTSFKRV